jgi:hypothetical protein
LLTEKYITGSCAISAGIVCKNDAVVFEHTDTDIAAFLLAVYQHFQLNYPKFYKMDSLSKLGWLASEILLKDNFEKSSYKPEEVGVVLANANSSLDNDLKYFNTIKDIPSPSVFVYTLPNIVIGEICIRNHFKGEHAFFIQESFDAEFIEQQVSYLLDHDILQTCICGWADVLERNYSAALFLIEKKKNENCALFSAENMDKIIP